MSDPDERSLRRWQWVGALVFVLLVGAFPAYRAVESGRRSEWLALREAALVGLGRQLWGANCASCHGPQGEGLPGFPALNAREFLQGATDEQIHHLVAAGVPGTAMAAWWNEFGGPLTDEQIRALVAYLRSWEAGAPSRPDWRSPAPPASPTPSPSPEERRGSVAITVTEQGCEPLEIEVEAGRTFTLRYANRSPHGSSLDVPSLAQHVHAGPGKTVTLRLTALQEGDYRFDCLGEAHGDLLGTGVIRAS